MEHWKIRAQPQGASKHHGNHRKVEFGKARFQEKSLKELTTELLLVVK